MKSRQVRILIFIVLIVLVALWVDMPNNPGINFAGINRQIDTRLGLDLVGGVQALLEADLPAEPEYRRGCHEYSRTNC